LAISSTTGGTAVACALNHDLRCGSAALLLAGASHPKPQTVSAKDSSVFKGRETMCLETSLIVPDGNSRRGSGRNSHFAMAYEKLNGDLLQPHTRFAVAKSKGDAEHSDSLVTLWLSRPKFATFSFMLFPM
jgi:hypothetical protein